MSSERSLRLRRRVRAVAAPAALALQLMTAGPARALDDLPSPVSAPPEDGALERARKMSARATALFDAGHYEAALAEFTRAYTALAGHPRQYFVLHNLAVCNARLQRYDRALELYEAYLQRAPADETDRARVSGEVQVLRSLVGIIVVQSAIGAEVWLDRRYLGRAPGRFTVPAGQHSIEIRAPLYETERRELRVAPGERRTVSFTPRRLSTYRGPSRAYFWSAIGLTGAATVAGTTLGLLALSERRRGLDRAELHLDTHREANRTDNLALAADACFGSALLFGATATVLYFVTDWPTERTPGSP